MIRVEYIGMGAEQTCVCDVNKVSAEIQTLLTKSVDEDEHKEYSISKVLVGAQPEGEIIKD